jgi:hypothetical protein
MKKLFVNYGVITDVLIKARSAYRIGASLDNLHNSDGEVVETSDEDREDIGADGLAMLRTLAALAVNEFDESAYSALFYALREKIETGQLAAGDIAIWLLDAYGNDVV